MANGHAAAFAVTFDTEDLEKLNLKSYKTYTDQLKEQNIDLDSFSQHIEHESEIEDATDKSISLVTEAFEAFKTEFRDTFGVEIYIGYHDSSEKGDIYDDIEDTYYSLAHEEVYELTDSAAKLKAKLPFEIKQFVVYG